MAVDEVDADEEDHLDVENIPFAGDYFGNEYSAQDFGWEEGLQWAEGIDTGRSDSSDDEPDGLDNVQDLGWEPARSPSPSGSSPAQEETRGSTALHTVEANPNERLRVEEALQRPIQRVLFPITSAGTPIEDRCNDTAAMAGYRLYETQLHPDTATDHNREKDMYAPFASKLDWETARWAKLRGPGSTAFTDLLRIDGVRHCMVNDSHHSIIDSAPYRFLINLDYHSKTRKS